MKIETYLNAMDEAWDDYYHNVDERKFRQYHAFRDRILRGDEGKKDAEIARLWKEIDLLKAENVRKMDETNRLKIEREFSDD